MNTIDIDDISVVVIEDHDKVRAALCAILEAAQGIHVVGDTAQEERGVELSAQQHPDVLVLDMDVPVLSGEEAAASVLHKFAATRVLVLTSYDDAEYARGMVNGGAAGCLLKEDVPDSLVQAVRTVQHEPYGVWISPGLLNDDPWDSVES